MGVKGKLWIQCRRAGTQPAGKYSPFVRLAKCVGNPVDNTVNERKTSAKPRIGPVWGKSCQTACKPGSVHAVHASGRRWTAIPLGRVSPRASRDQPGQQGGNPLASRLAPHAGHPYSVLLPVGFTLPAPLPGPRCAVAAPFHPCLPADAGRRFVFCGTIPGVAPAGRYPAPCSRGARTFLQYVNASAAVRPSGSGVGVRWKEG